MIAYIQFLFSVKLSFYLLSISLLSPKMAFAFILKVQAGFQVLSQLIKQQQKPPQNPQMNDTSKLCMYHTPLWDVHYSRYETKRQKHSFLVGHESSYEHHGSL